jgi:hypothetical protein
MADKIGKQSGSSVGSGRKSADVVMTPGGPRQHSKTHLLGPEEIIIRKSDKVTIIVSKKPQKNKPA